MEAELSCRFCFKLYENPVTLACGHSICKFCAETLKSLNTVQTTNKINLEAFISTAQQAAAQHEDRTHSNNNETSNLNLDIVCPVCSETTAVPLIDGICSLQKDEKLISAVEAYKAAATTCAQCENNGAQVQCTTCKVPMCQDCFDELHKQKVLQSHQSVPLSSTDQKRYTIVRCPTHHELLKMYCLTCDRAICMMCPHSGHRDHNCVPVVDVENNFLSEIGSSSQSGGELHSTYLQLGGILENVTDMITTVESRHDWIDNEICREFDGLIQLLTERKKRLLDISSDIKQKKTSVLKEQADSLTTIRSRAQQLMDEAATLADESERSSTTNDLTVNLAITKQHIANTVNHTKNSFRRPFTDDTMYWQLDTTQWKQSVPSLGALWIHQAPGKPEPPVLIDSTSTSISLRWNPPSNSGSTPITGYSLVLVETVHNADPDSSSQRTESHPNTQPSKQRLVEVYRGEDNSFTITNLMLDARYVFKVAAFNCTAGAIRLNGNSLSDNNHHLGEYSEAITVSTLREFCFEKTFDTNGFLWWLGTAKGTLQKWTNPASAKAPIICVSASSISAGSAESFIDRNYEGYFHTNNVPRSWVKLDLVNYRITPTHYSIRSDSHSHYKLRNWELQASNNGDDDSAWVTLCVHVNDTSLKDVRYASASWEIPRRPVFDSEDAESESYRFLRVIQTGKNSSGSDHLKMTGFEVYGEVF